MSIKEYLSKFNLSFEKLSQNYKESYQVVLNEEKQNNWLINLEDKVNLLNNEREQKSINRIITKLKNDEGFTTDDTEDLKTFIAKINSITHIADRINNFKEGVNLDNGEKLILHQLFNKIANTNKLEELDSYILNKNLNSFKPHIFSVIKHCQEPQEYPIYYKFWKNIATEVLGITNHYDALCLFYRKFPKTNRHFVFGTYFGTLAKLIISNFSGSSIIDKEKGLKYIKDKVINLEKYFVLLNDTDRNIELINESSMKNLPPPLNQILFGAPGTGKTYNTKRIAVEIINGEKPRTREEINAEYESLVNAKQIVFTTFHQSLSYEDFIEGIKPETTDGNVTYEVKDGIFKSLCQNAVKTITNNKADNFDEVWDKLIETVKNEIANDKLLKIGSWEYGLSTKDSLKYSSINSPSQYSFTITKQNVLDAYQNKQARPSGAFQKDMKDIVEYMKANLNLTNYKENKEVFHSNVPYVLIIDEINRGNVSAIFGELITLLEEDKRKGNKEQTEVTLPYSADKFSVPNNVYVIGTMNTADRSVEALDTALRRRFSFTEMQPNPKILSNSEYLDVDLKQLLEAINQRIEVLIDKDHQIGHSYFIGIRNLDDLKLVFKDKIIPLLEEYFYGDFGKIGLVLGGNFIFQEENTAKFPKNFIYENDFLEDKKVYRFTPFEYWSESTFISVYED